MRNNFFFFVKSGTIFPQTRYKNRGETKETETKELWNNILTDLVWMNNYSWETSLRDYSFRSIVIYFFRQERTRTLSLSIYLSMKKKDCFCFWRWLLWNCYSFVKLLDIYRLCFFSSRFNLSFISFNSFFYFSHFFLAINSSSWQLSIRKE